MFREFDRGKAEAGLRGTRFAGHIHHFPCVTSTNTLALDAAQAGTQGGVWVADEQTGGRGRGSHGWHSAAGEGLYLSVLVVPQMPPTRALWIALATALAARSAIAAVSGLFADIRWPNDLLLGSKKCGGILVESSLSAALPAGSERMRYAVIGVGINVAHESFPEELQQEATSLRLASGRVIAREDLMISLLQALDRELAALDEAKGGRQVGETLERITEASSWVLGRRVRVGEKDGYTGVTAGLSPEGFLLVMADDGSLRTVLSGGVRSLDAT